MMKMEDTRGIGTSCTPKPSTCRLQVVLKEYPPTHFSGLRSIKGYLQNEIPGHVGVSTRFSGLKKKKGYLQNEIPSHVGAYTLTHPAPFLFSHFHVYLLFLQDASGNYRPLAAPSPPTGAADCEMRR